MISSKLIKRIFLCFLIIFGIKNTVVAQMADSLANYYYYVNQAELLIADEDFVGAENRYRRASEFKSNWYGRDLFNLSLLQLKLEKSKDANATLEKLKLKGFDIELLKEKPTFNSYFDTKKGKKLKSSLIKIEALYRKDIRAVIDSLYELSESVSKDYGSIKFNDSIAIIDSSIVYKLTEFIAEHGFPTEDLIGIHGWFTYSPIVTLMKHHSNHRQIGMVVDFVEFINESGFNGSMKNDNVANTISSISSHDQYNFRGTIKKYVFQKSLDSTGSNQDQRDSVYTYFINGYPHVLMKERQQLGLPTMEEEFKLMKYNWENETEFILGHAKKNTYLIDDKGTFDIIRKMEKTIEIKEP